MPRKDPLLGRKMNRKDPRGIGRRFLEDLDSHLKEVWPKLTCREVAEIYFGFFEDLKCFRGTSGGFTGLSELLIFRFLFHQLGGRFKPVKRTRDQWEFRAEGDDGIRLGQNLPVKGSGNRYRPDVVLFKGEELLAAIQVKTYLVSGRRTFQDELTKLEDLRARYRGLRALLVIFDRLPARGETERYLETEAEKAGWWDFLFLRDDNERLADRIESILDLRARIGSDP